MSDELDLDTIEKVSLTTADCLLTGYSEGKPSAFAILRVQVPLLVAEVRRLRKQVGQLQTQLNDYAELQEKRDTAGWAVLENITEADKIFEKLISRRRKT